VQRSENRLFFPQSTLDDWIVAGSVEFEDGELVILPRGRRFKLTEAVRVLQEVSGTGDAHDLTGRAKDRAELEGLGAELVESSMLLGDAAYDTIPGWFGVPVGSGAGLTAAANKGKEEAEPETDEELLLKFLAKGL
jgi:hypothetical protein